MADYKIINYESRYEKSWIRCRLLSFLDSAYYDDVNTKKEEYANPSIALIAIIGEKVIGLLDIEYELEANSICSKNDLLGEHLAGMIWHLGTHPDFRKRGIAKELLKKAIQQAKKRNIMRFEAWTRDDEFVNAWYTKNGFALIDEYIHWYYDSRYDNNALINKLLKMEEGTSQIMQVFGHSRIMTNEIEKLNRKYFCRRFDKII